MMTRLCPVTCGRLTAQSPTRPMITLSTPRAKPSGASNPVKLAQSASRPVIRPAVAHALTRARRCSAKAAPTVPGSSSIP
jgi:hypothetical protein